MGVDSNTLLRQTAQDIVNGLNQDGMGSLADQVCSKISRDALKGTEPYRATVDTLPRTVSGVAIGADFREREFALTSLNWDMLQYDEQFSLVDQELADLNQYMPALQRYMATVRRDVNLGIDNDLKTLLEAETNTKAASAGAWDVGTSEPITDMQDGIKANVPGADLMILGSQTALDLARHPDFTVQLANYGSGVSLGAGGQFAAVRSAIESFTGIAAANIYVAGIFYNSANPGQSYSLSHLFDDFCWVGYREGLVMVEQPGSGTVYTDEEMSRQSIGYCRTLDLIRFDAALGLEFTGIGT